MIEIRPRLLGACLAVACALSIPGPVFGLTESEPPATGAEIPADLAEGLTISLVHVQLLSSTGDDAQDEALRRAVADAFGIRAGAIFRRLPQELALRQVQELPEVASATMRFFRTLSPGQVALAVLVTPEVGEPAAEAQPSGMAVSGRWSDFPTIYANNRSKLTLIVGGGFGLFSDTDPWFGGFGEEFNAGSPIADDPLGSGTSTWGESYIEAGLGGISRISDTPLYAYGAFSYLLSGSSGHDIYNSGTRGYGDFEKLYAGLIWDLPGEGRMVDLSVGRQVYQLRDGFLLSKVPVSTSVGERAALYLGPRLTSNNTVLLRAKGSRLALDAFLIEPSELDIISTDTRLAGANLAYNFADAELAFTYFYVPRSDSVFRAPDGVRLPREGLRTYNPSLSLKRVFGLDGAWLKAEYAYQDHEDFDMSAWAGYVWTGFKALERPWQPAISYRWSKFSGDDPDTGKFERFDPLFSGGLGNFLPGIVFSKAYKNSNLITNRGTLSVKPRPNIELILDYFRHRAHQLNNLGGIGPLQTLTSTDIGEEVTVTYYHYIGTHMFLQGIASVAMPGRAIKDALPEAASNWYTLQLALYWYF